MIGSFHLWRRFLRLAVARLAYYRINFLAVVGYWLVSLFVLVVFWKVVFRFLPERLGDWDFPRLCILNSMCYVSWGIFVFLWGLYQIPVKVVSGDLDKYLSRPISPLIGVIGEEIRLEGVYEVTAGIFGVVLFTLTYQLYPTFLHCIECIFAILMGTITLAFLHGSISLAAFWIGRVDSMRYIVDSMDEFQKYPISLFPTGLKFVLMSIVPLYFPGTFAAQIYLGHQPPLWHWVLFGAITLGWSCLFAALYGRCLRRYEANG